MQTLPVFRFVDIQPTIQILEKVGAPVGRLLRDTHLPVLALGDPNVFVPTHLGMKFCGRASKTEGIENLGLLSGQLLVPESASFMRESLMAAQTVGEALLRLTKAIRSESPTLRLELRCLRSLAVLSYEPSIPFECEGGEFDEQLMIAILVGFLRSALGSDWQPTCVLSRTRDVGVLQQSELLRDGRVVASSRRTAICFPESELKLGVKRLARDASGASPALPPPTGFAAILERVISPFVQEGLPSIESAAEMVGTSSRSLQRRLANDDLTYRILCERVRVSQAIDMLTRTRIPLSELAQELGYSDAANFSRAFRRRMGSSPGEYRKRFLPGR